MLTGERHVSRISQYHLARLLNQDYPRPPCTHARKLTRTTLRAWFLGSPGLNRKDFAYYQCNEKNDPSLAWEFRVPLPVPASGRNPIGAQIAELIRVVSTLDYHHIGFDS